MRACDLYAALDQQPLATQRCARHEAGLFSERELRDVDGMKAIDILRRIERPDDG
jgi:hypothetical protein